MDPHLQICQHLLLSGVDPSLFPQSCHILPWSQSSRSSQILTPSWHKGIKDIKPHVQRQTLCHTASQYHVKYLTIMLREVMQQQLADMPAKYLRKEIHEMWSKVNNELGTRFLKCSHILNCSDDAFHNGYMSVNVCEVTTASLNVCEATTVSLYVCAVTNLSLYFCKVTSVSLYVCQVTSVSLHVCAVTSVSLYVCAGTSVSLYVCEMTTVSLCLCSDQCFIVCLWNDHCFIIWGLSGKFSNI